MTEAFDKLLKKLTTYEDLNLVPHEVWDDIASRCHASLSHAELVEKGGQCIGLRCQDSATGDDIFLKVIWLEQENKTALEKGIEKVLGRSNKEILDEAKRRIFRGVKIQHFLSGRIKSGVIPKILHAREKYDSYIAMQFFSGVDYFSYISTIEEQSKRLHVFMQVCELIKEIHGKGIVHTDIKPANILVKNGGKDLTICLVDWGNTRDLKDEEALTGNFTAIGSPQYMTQEQWLRAATRDFRTDIAQLGFLLWVTLAREEAACIENHTTRIKEPQYLPEKIPLEFMNIFVRATASDPDKRYQVVSDFIRDLKKVIGQQEVLEKTETIAYQCATPCKALKDLESKVDHLFMSIFEATKI